MDSVVSLASCPSRRPQCASTVSATSVASVVLVVVVVMQVVARPFDKDVWREFVGASPSKRPIVAAIPSPALALVPRLVAL